MKKSVNILVLSIVNIIASGCSQSSPSVVTLPVHLPVVVPCVEQIPAKPLFALDKGETPIDAVSQLKAMLSDLMVARSYIAELEAVLQGC